MDEIERSETPLGGRSFSEDPKRDPNSFLFSVSGVCMSGCCSFAFDVFGFCSGVGAPWCLRETFGSSVSVRVCAWFGFVLGAWSGCPVSGVRSSFLKSRAPYFLQGRGRRVGVRGPACRGRS
jgi:hypothetical protein